SKAIAIASDFLEKKGYRLDGFHIMASISTNDSAFFYLQKRYGWERTQEFARTGEQKGLGTGWSLEWFKNVPRDSAYERYLVSVSGTGKVVGFNHIYPETLDWPAGRNAHTDQSRALELARQFLKNQGIDFNGYQKDSFNTEKFDKRTDHRFSWNKPLPSAGTRVNLIVRVRGDEVGGFQLVFGVPTAESTQYSQIESKESFIGIMSYVFAFLLCLALQIIFLRKYHEGEVSVKTAAIVFFVCWIVMSLETFLKFRNTSFTAQIGPMNPDAVGWVVSILLCLVVWPFFSIMGFSAWSVGESIGRERFGRKFTAMDSLFNKKFSTLNVASSAFNGYVAGFFGLGLLALLFSGMEGVFNNSIDGISYRVTSTFLPFLVPPLYAISSALLSEMVFRLFGNLFLYKYLKRRWLTLLASAVPWTLYSYGFWGLTVSITPFYMHWAVLYIMGLLLGYLFWKFDLLTAIIANYTIIGVMQSLPLVSNSAPGLFYHGVAALVILFLPVLFIIYGFIKQNRFSFEADLMPAHIKRITERARMSKELEIARQVQMRLLPGKSPEIDGFDIDGICIPANEVGGDYYDFIPIDDSRLAIVVGDVSGKGVPAAIYMTLTKGVIQAQSENQLSPREVLTRVNRSLYAMMDTKSFVTLFFAVMDRETKSLTFSRAGHNPLLYFRNSDHQIISLRPDGIALGIEGGKIFDITVKTAEIQLSTGDLVVFYTDGITEAMNKNLEEYGEQRLMDVIQCNKTQTAAQIIKDVIGDVEAFVKGYPQHDDMTMVIVKVY
ncbi:MAG: PP2C family protein-serine/threonine phosphatase, partial [bacterium]|nr:PP2C family protein-serine/threonine phosphatase [bacterium]